MNKVMTLWYTPTNFKSWLRRLLALRSVVLLILLIALVVTEFRFDWIETSVGAFLVTTNGQRPESGAIWDQGRQSDLARQTLAQYVDQRQNVQREARRATSMGQVVSGIENDRGAMISASHFIELYLKLPPVLSHEIISPYTLLIHLGTGNWQRTFFERQGQQLAVYLLDDHSQVLHHLTVGPGLLEHIQRGEVAIHASLYHLSDFAAHIYPAADFFAALNGLPAVVRKGIIAHPEELLRVSGRIVRVGISSDDSEDAVDLGFEVEDVEGPRVILMQGRSTDVRHLKWILEDRALTNGSVSREAQPWP